MKIGRRKIEKGYLVGIGILSLFLLVGYYSYALFTINREETRTISIKTGTLVSTLTSTDEAFTANKVTVKSNETKTLTITLENKNGRDAKFNFYYEVVSEGVTVGYLAETKDIPPGEEGIVIKNGESKSYSVEIKNTTGGSIAVTFGSDAGLFDKDLSFPSNAHVLEEKKREIAKDESGANVPELGSMLVPVVYNVTSTNWEVADVETAKKWYDYDAQKWANAVVVTPETYNSTYKNARAGTEVNMDDILQMYVWIPRYSYAIKKDKEAGSSDYYGEGGTSRELPGAITIQFIDTGTKNDGDEKYEELPTNNDWYTPSAFTLGEQNLSGIWVGKFKAGYKGAGSKSSAERNTADPTKVVIKPNVYTWRNIKVNTIFNVARGIVESTDTFGLSSQEYDSHAMKNSEWGAAAYLSQSKYGKYGNADYQDLDKEIYVNNYVDCVTGRSHGKPDTNTTDGESSTQYNDINNQDNATGPGPGASTTGNIYGIYDMSMSGDYYEFVMGNINGLTSSSGFTGNKGTWYTGTDNKYFDFYNSTDMKTEEFKSHAMGGITAGWYGDARPTLTTSNPWIMRDDIFGYVSHTGSISRKYSFRVVLTLNETEK